MTFRRLCLKDWTSRDSAGALCQLKHGKDYLTDGPHEDELGEFYRVVSGYWFRVPAEYFDREAITKAPGSKRAVEPVNDAFMAQLRSMARYQGVDLTAALRKCALWACGGRVPTRHRFIAYLDKNHKPRKAIA
jgi:hypothetical protein